MLVSSVVAAQIIKHARDNLPALVTGQLLGIDAEDRVEASFSFPLLKQSASGLQQPLVADKEEAAQTAATQHQVQMLRLLRQVNVDSSIVGWYQTALLGGLINDALIETQYQYQSSLPHAVVLVYDPLRSAQGALSLRAFRLSEPFMAFFAGGVFSTERLLAYQLSHAAVLLELPVEVQGSVLLEGLLAELACAGALPPAARLDLPQASDVERTLEQMIDYSDDLVQDMAQHQFWQRRRHAQLQLHAKRAHQRRELNADRLARGLPALPDDHDAPKTLPEPPRLDALLLAAQLDQYAAHLNAFAGQAFGKLFLLEGLQAESSSLAYPNSSYAAHAQKAIHP